MEKLSVELPFQISREELNRATKEFVWKVYKERLGRDPLQEDNARFYNRYNEKNSFIQDMFLDGVKYGELATTVYFDSPGHTELTFTPEKV